MWHSCAYQLTMALTATRQQLPAVADSIFKIGGGNGFVLQEDMALLQAYAGGVQLTLPQLQSPKLNQFNPLTLSPNSATQSVTDGLEVCTFPYRPFVFRNQEEVTAFATNGNAAANVDTIIASFSNGIDPIPPGETLTLTATGATAAVANTWTLEPFTLTQVLPEGIYAMIASECISASGVHHRWTFWNQFYRPGMPSSTAFTNRQAACVRELSLGLMGQFSNVTLPNLEVFCSAADAAFTILMRVIKVA